ncbi:hypothetical protein C8F04DRAFT_1338088 [Mycena alexandri]|uniref:Uncharacterized protein n=1 Tax=Mycena alexandri TaxID=1745969 RepID=A0AAD6RX91_9AGAR|nr:hypothetical protein C8F04DRAFT_1338088 [Mycena alexandri]
MALPCPPPPPPRDTINLVSPTGPAIDLVSPTAPAANLAAAEASATDHRSAVRSPQLTSVPLASLVARAADAFVAGADISTATAALTIDTTNLAAPQDGAVEGNFPPLPPPGEEVMDSTAAAARRAAKNKASAVEHAVAESANLGPNAILLAPEQEQRDFERARQESLGIAPPTTHGASSSARRPEGGSGSPPKRTRTDAPIRVTRASSAAAAQAAAAAVAAALAPPAATVIPRPATAAAVPQAGAAPHAGAPAPPPLAPVLAPAPQHPQPAVPIANPRTYDGQAPRVFVTQGQFPETTADPAARTRNVDPGQSTTWQNTPGTFLAVVSGGSVDPVGESQDGVDLLAGATNVPRELIRMGAANPANPPPPHSQCLRVKQITLFLYALVPDSFSGFLGNIEGLTFPNTPAGAQEAANMITNTLSITPAFIQLVMNHRDNLPAHWSIQQALTAILGSITVSPIELLSPCGPRVVWSVYMMVTTNDAVAYNAIRAVFAPTLFVTAFNNTGRVRADMFCRICESIDHPTPLCPFPNVPGWMGPTPRLTHRCPYRYTRRTRAW